MITKNDPLLLQYRAERDDRKRRRIADRLIRENQPLIEKLVKKFSFFAPESIEFDDLMQAGYIAFMYAIDHIDTTRTFSTYYAFRVWFECSKLIEKSGLIHHPRGRGMPFKILKKMEAFRTQYGREPTAEDLGVSQKKMDQWREIPTTCSMDVSGTPWDSADPSLDPEQALLNKERDAAVEEARTDLTEGETKVLDALMKGEDPKKLAKRLAMPLPWLLDTKTCAIRKLRRATSE